MCNFTWKCVNEAWEQTHLAVTWAGSAGLPACCTSCRCWEWRARGSWPRCPDLGTRSTSASPPPHDRSPSLYASTQITRVSCRRRTRATRSVINWAVLGRTKPTTFVYDDVDWRGVAKLQEILRARCTCLTKWSTARSSALSQDT